MRGLNEAVADLPAGMDLLGVEEFGEGSLAVKTTCVNAEASLNRSQVSTAIKGVKSQDESSLNNKQASTRSNLVKPSSALKETPATQLFRS